MGVHGNQGGYGRERERVPGRIVQAAKMSRVRVREAKPKRSGPHPDPLPRGEGDSKADPPESPLGKGGGYVVEVNTGRGQASWCSVIGPIELLEARRVHSIIESAWAAEKADWMAARERKFGR